MKKELKEKLLALQGAKKQTLNVTSVSPVSTDKKGNKFLTLFLMEEIEDFRGGNLIKVDNFFLYEEKVKSVVNNNMDLTALGVIPSLGLLRPLLLSGKIEVVSVPVTANIAWVNPITGETQLPMADNLLHFIIGVELNKEAFNIFSNTVKRELQSATDDAIKAMVRKQMGLE